MIFEAHIELRKDSLQLEDTFLLYVWPCLQCSRILASLTLLVLSFLRKQGGWQTKKKKKEQLTDAFYCGICVTKIKDVLTHDVLYSDVCKAI